MLVSFFWFWLFRKLPLGRLDLSFGIISIHPRFITSSYPFKHFRIVVGFIEQLLGTALGRNSIISEQILMPQVSCPKHPNKLLGMRKIISQHQQQSMIVVRWLSTIILFTFSALSLSSIFDVLKHPERSLSLTSSWPYWKRLYHLKMFVLLKN